MLKSLRKMMTALLVAAMVSPLAGCTSLGDAGQTEGRITVNDINVAYRVFGTGDPVFMIMGYGSTMNLWETGLLRQLAGRFKVIIFDNRGMGNTSAGTRDFSIEQFADDTSGLMDALQISRAHVLGWSMGSMVAQELALRHPAKVDKLILYAAYSDPMMFPAAPDVIKRLADTSGTAQERGMRYISVLFPSSWMRNNGERVKEVFFRPMGNIPQETLARQVTAIESWKGSSDRLGRILQPTLLIAGAEDVLVVPSNASYLQGRIAGARLDLVEGGGHGLMFQYPDAFSRTVTGFLE